MIVMNGTWKAAGVALAALAVTGAFLLVLGALPRAGAEEGPYPVWWSPRLELESLDAIDERLARPIWHDGYRVSMTRVRRDAGRAPSSRAPDHAEARTCEELLALQETGFVPDYRPDWTLFESYLATCTAIRLLGRARPAVTGFVRPLTFDDTALVILPAVLKSGRTCEEWSALRAQTLAGGSLAETMKTVKRYYVKFDGWVYDDDEWHLLMNVLSYGDFNNDGRDDVFLTVNANAVDRSDSGRNTYYETSTYYVLSRAAAAARLEILMDGVRRSVSRNECLPSPPLG